MMHIGNVVFAKRLRGCMLYPRLDGPEDARVVVVVGSAAFLGGSLHSSLFEGSGAGDFKGEVTDNCPTLAEVYLLPAPSLFSSPFLAAPQANGYSLASQSRQQTCSARLSDIGDRTLPPRLASPRQLTASMPPHEGGREGGPAPLPVPLAKPTTYGLLLLLSGR